MSLLPDADSFRRLVDGTTQGPGATATRLALAAAALPYGVVVTARNAAFDLGLLPQQTAGVPVLSVGNLTLGGTGKTPLVAWVARALATGGHRPAIVSRGYGAAAGSISDEALELSLVLSGVPHVADRDRVAGARRAAAAGATAVVLDDGFQHRRLARDIDIMAVDATDPFGCGRLFPRGLLREPLAGSGRADAIVLTRSDAVAAGRREEIRARMSAACRGREPAVWAEAVHRPVGLRAWDGPRRPLDALHGPRVAAFAAIGNPAAFRRTLESLGAELVDFQALPDHHAYVPADLEALGRRATDAGADLVVTTLKDLVKIRRRELHGLPLVALEIALDIVAGRAELEAVVHRATGGSRA
jgi:tetraacyldisaccharide 4'-kinase